MKAITNEQLFLKVIEAGSFKQAALQLDTDPSSVSRSISNLEKRLGVKLIERSTKRSAPTESGQQYYTGLKRLLDEQHSLERGISGTLNTPTGALKIAAPHDFGCQFIVPVIEQMAQQFPELSVELVLGSQFEDLKTNAIDVAIRVGQLPDSSLICKKIGDVPRVIVASPSYLAKHGTPDTPQALSKHPFILYKKAHYGTTVTLNDTKIHTLGSITVNSVSAVKQLVLKGNGLHIGPKWAFKDEIEQGQLVALFADEHINHFPVHALYLSRKYVPAKIKHFVAQLTQRYQQKGFC